MTKTAFIGLGSNLKQPSQQLLNAIEELEYLSSIQVLDISPFYQTKPVGYANQPDFINAVVKITTDLDYLMLLEKLRSIETKLGRIRDTLKYGPRTIDLDLLLYDKIEINTAELIIPHPRMLERGFVLYPLFDLQPDCYIFQKINWPEFQRQNPRPKILEHIYDEVT